MVPRNVVDVVNKAGTCLRVSPVVIPADSPKVLHISNAQRSFQGILDAKEQVENPQRSSRHPSGSLRTSAPSQVPGPRSGWWNGR